MARGRMLSQTVATDRKLNELSVEAELLYIKAIPHLDRDGLIMGDSMLLWAQVCPRRSELMAKMDGIVEEWLSSGLVIAYDDNGDIILFFPSHDRARLIILIFVPRMERVKTKSRRHRSYETSSSMANLSRHFQKLLCKYTRRKFLYNYRKYRSFSNIQTTKPKHIHNKSRTK